MPGERGLLTEGDAWDGVSRRIRTSRGHSPLGSTRSTCGKKLMRYHPPIQQGAQNREVEVLRFDTPHYFQISCYSPLADLGRGRSRECTSLTIRRHRLWQLRDILSAKALFCLGQLPSARRRNGALIVPENRCQI